MITGRKESLTGETRFHARRRFLRSPLIVLQVEVRITGEKTTDLGRGGIDIECFEYTKWRDATWNDVLDAVIQPQISGKLAAA